MKVTPQMQIKEALGSNEQIANTYQWISPAIAPTYPGRLGDTSEPRELWGLKDNDQHVVFVDVILRVQRNENPWPAIMHGLTELRDYEDVLLLRHSLDPLWLREKFGTCGFASWAEERRIGEWFIYFYRPTASEGAVA